jgi:hypothetical protein
MKRTVLVVVVAGLVAATGGVLDSSDAFGKGVTCSGTPGTLSGTTINANVAVPSGSWCDIQTQTVNGNVSVAPGGGLVIGAGSTINGNVNSNGAGTFPGDKCGGGLITNFSVVLGSGNTFNGHVTIIGSNAGVIVGGGGCGSESISRNLAVNSNKSVVNVDGNSVSGNAQVNNNTPGPTKVTNNTVTRNLACSGNAAFTASGNTANTKTGQCA